MMPLPAINRHETLATVEYGDVSIFYPVDPEGKTLDERLAWDWQKLGNKYLTVKRALRQRGTLERFVLVTLQSSHGKLRQGAKVLIPCLWVTSS